jgi:hypothetical protein
MPLSILLKSREVAGLLDIEPNPELAKQKSMSDRDYFIGRLKALKMRGELADEMNRYLIAMCETIKVYQICFPDASMNNVNQGVKLIRREIGL